MNLAAGLSPVNPGLALLMVVVAVLLNVIPNLFSRFRDGKRKEGPDAHGIFASFRIPTPSR